MGYFLLREVGGVDASQLRRRRVRRVRPLPHPAAGVVARGQPVRDQLRQSLHDGKRWLDDLERLVMRFSRRRFLLGGAGI